MSKQNKNIVQEINTAFASGDTKTFLTHCAENVTWTLIGDNPHRGKNEVREFLATLKDHEPPRFTVDKLIADDNSVVCLGQMLMKNKAGIAENYEFCDIYEFKGDQIVDLVSFVVRQNTAGEKTRAATL